MNILQRTFYMIIASIFILSASCRKNPAGFTLPNDPRVYTWTADTLLYYDRHGIDWATSVFKLWGSSAHDVYAVGYCTDWDGQMYHYNGITWSPETKVHKVWNWNIMKDIFGFSEDDVWAAAGGEFGYGESTNWTSQILHFNGSSWEKVFESEHDTSWYRVLFSVWGSSPESIWFGGCYGDMFFWNGTEVKKDSLLFDSNKYVSNHYVTRFNAIAGYPGKGVYAILSGTKACRQYLVERKTEGWDIVGGHNLYSDIWMSPSGRLYTGSIHGVFEWNGSSLVPIYTDIHCTAVFGTDDDHIFAVGRTADYQYSEIVYYNGHSWHSLPECRMRAVDFFDVWTDVEEVFISGEPDNEWSTIILHGTMESKENN